MIPPRWSSHSTPLAGRLMSKVEFAPNGCWLWTGYRDEQTGYGRLTYNSAPLYAHRAAFEVFIGPIPDGAQLDHQCHNRDESCPGGRCDHRRCMNPWHVTPATPLENTHSGKGNAAKTHCPQGHPYSAENTMRTSGRRYCKTCQGARVKTVKPEQHGTCTGYTYGCRCAPCRAAVRDYHRARKAAA